MVPPKLNAVRKEGAMVHPESVIQRVSFVAQVALSIHKIHTYAAGVLLFSIIVAAFLLRRKILKDLVCGLVNFIPSIAKQSMRELL
jgi:hypothetical protein